MQPEIREVRRWLLKATQDWSAVKKLMATTDPELAIAAFHCQQAVEKALKGYLVFQRTEFEKVHDLKSIVRLCCQSDPTFDSLLDDVDPLTVFAVAVRYPGPDDPTVEQVRNAMLAVEKAWKFIVKRLPESCVP